MPSVSGWDSEMAREESKGPQEAVRRGSRDNVGTEGLNDHPNSYFELKDFFVSDYKKLVKTNTKLEQQVSDLKKELKRTYGIAVADNNKKPLAFFIIRGYNCPTL